MGIFCRYIIKFKIEQKLPKMVFIIPNFTILQFGENFMKIRTEIAKLQMHEFCIKCQGKYVFIHIFMQIFISFYDGQLKQQICYSFMLLISFMVFNPFKIAIQFFKSA